jgi:hypothetical protein
MNLAGTEVSDPAPSTDVAGDAPELDPDATATTAGALGEELGTADESDAELAVALRLMEETVALHGDPDYSAILTRRYPDAQWSLNGNDPDSIEWRGPGPRPTRGELDAHWPSVAEELAEERAARAKADAATAAAREAELAARRSDPDTLALLDGFDPRTIWCSAPDYSAILSRRFPGAQWSLNGNDPVGGLDWMASGPKPTKAELDALWAEVAREMALEMDPRELSRWAGVGEQVYVDGVLRPRGWVGGANDPQPAPVANADNLQYLPQIPPSNNGSPVGTLDVFKDPTGAKNFEQLYGIQLHELGAMIAEAHGYFGGSHSLGLGLNGDRELMWYSDQIGRAHV